MSVALAPARSPALRIALPRSIRARACSRRAPAPAKASTAAPSVSLIAVVDQRVSVERHPDGARDAEAPGKDELFLREGARPVGIAELVVAEGGLGAPRDRADAGGGLPVALEALAFLKRVECRPRIALGRQKVRPAGTQRLRWRGVRVERERLEPLERLASLAELPALDEHEDERCDSHAQRDGPTGHAGFLEASASVRLGRASRPAR